MASVAELKERIKKQRGAEKGPVPSDPAVPKVTGGPAKPKESGAFDFFKKILKGEHTPTEKTLEMMDDAGAAVTTSAPVTTTGRPSTPEEAKLAVGAAAIPGSILGAMASGAAAPYIVGGGVKSPGARALLEKALIPSAGGALTGQLFRGAAGEEVSPKAAGAETLLGTVLPGLLGGVGKGLQKLGDVPFRRGFHIGKLVRKAKHDPSEDVLSGLKEMGGKFPTKEKIFKEFHKRKSPIEEKFEELFTRKIETKGPRGGKRFEKLGNQPASAFQARQRALNEAEIIVDDEVRKQVKRIINNKISDPKKMSSLEQLHRLKSELQKKVAEGDPQKNARIKAQEILSRHVKDILKQKYPEYGNLLKESREKVYKFNPFVEEAESAAKSKPPIGLIEGATIGPALYGGYHAFSSGHPLLGLLMSSPAYMAAAQKYLPMGAMHGGMGRLLSGAGKRAPYATAPLIEKSLLGAE